MLELSITFDKPTDLISKSDESIEFALFVFWKSLITKVKISDVIPIIWKKLAILKSVNFFFISSGANNTPESKA